LKIIPLTQGEVAFVGDEDFESVNQYKWCVVKDTSSLFYTCGWSKKKKKNIQMHRLIMNAQKGQQIDHINHNGLDNRKCNLRFVNHSQNQQNNLTTKGKSPFKGVVWNKRGQKYYAQIGLNNATIYLGSYHNDVIAAWAYDQAAKKLFGEYARLNFS